MLNFLKSLDKDLRDTLLVQLRNLWTHTSTAIEGNTLTLAETAFVLEERLTIPGKPLKDQEEVVGHARAIDLIYGCIAKGAFSKNDLFALHKAVQADVIVDVYKPVGCWKNEPNSSVGTVNGRQVVFEYGKVSDIPKLMESWFALYHNFDQTISEGDTEKALTAYVQLHVAFVRIHPFFDGNGRMARLISNLPILKAGLPPIIIPSELRKEYIDILSAYHFEVGQIQATGELLPNLKELQPFTAFCEHAWLESIVLVDEARKIQEARQEMD
jgi:Fic family protein